MPWLHVRTQAPGASAEHVGERLREAGAVAVSLLPADQNDAILEPAPQADPELWEEVRVEALLPLGADLSFLRGAGPSRSPAEGSFLRGAGPSRSPAEGSALPPLDCAIDFMADEDWSETWRRDVRELHFGRLRVVPTSHRPATAPGQATVYLDPGLAFGTGTHPSTALCLRWLAAQDLAGKRVLDVGTGSGILAIAARRLDAAAVTAVDHDPQARRACRRNALANGLQLVALDDLEATAGKYDIAVANIVADTLCALAPAISERAERIALSGLLERQTKRVRSAFARFDFQPPTVQDGWALLEGVRRE